MNKNKSVEIPIFDYSAECHEIKLVLRPNCTTADLDNSSAKKSFAWSKFSKTILIVFILEVATVYGLLFLINPKTASSEASNTSAQREDKINADKLIALTNTTRKDYGLEELKFSQQLSQAAENKAKYILTNSSFDHNGLEGQTFSYWIKNVDYDYIRVGENLAINYNNPNDILNAWLESPAHRKNLLNPLYSEIGIAAVPGSYQGKNSIVVVQLFGTPE